VSDAVDHHGQPEAQLPGSGTFHAVDPPVFNHPPKRYAAFISYSHSADGAFAPALQDGLQRLAKPWNQRRALEVFRDQTGLSVSPALWPSICAALDGSDWFVVLASPEAARSDWVGKEIERWVATKGSENILPVLTDGAWVWNTETNNFDRDASTAVHPSLYGIFHSQPLYLNMTWAKNEHHLTLRNARFRDQVAGLAAPMHGITKDELEGGDVREQHRTERVKQGAISILTILLVLAITASVIAFRQYSNAIQERDVAVSRQVAGQALELRNTNPALAEQLALAAYRLAPTTEARSSLLSAIANPYATRLTGTSSDFNGMALSPDGHTLASPSIDSTARLWDISDPHQPHPLSTLTGHTNAVNSVAFSPNEHTLATASADHTVRLWDVSDPHQPHPLSTLTGHTNAVNSVAFSPNEHTLATTSTDTTGRLWDVSDPRQPALLGTLTGHTNGVYSVAFSPDGHTLATTSTDTTARLWDVSDPHQPTFLGTLTGHTNRVYSVAFSPDGHTLATGSVDGTARLWETNVDRVTARICSVTPAITTSQWDHYLHDLAYRPPCP
jgi:WD40 repeat protein